MALLACVVLLGCGETSSTVLRVRIDSDMAVGTELTRLELSVTDEAENSTNVVFSDGTDVDGDTLPWEVDLKQRSGLPAPLRVIVRGYGQEDADSVEVETGRREVLARFDPQNTVLLDVALARSCLGTTCDDQTLDTTCDATSGLCAAVVEATGLQIVD